MASKFYADKEKATRMQTPEVSTTPAQGMFESRSFEVASPQAVASQPPLDLNTALMQAQRYGHNLSRMQFAEPSATSVQPKNKMCQPRQGVTTAPLQAKLTLGQPGDKYEQEADQVAARVVNQINTPSSQPNIQRARASGSSTKLKRPSGISTKLARARFNLNGKNKTRGVKFKDWKKGYEAQHIIPHAVATELKLPMDDINAARNGMMLPSGRANALKPAWKAQTKFTKRPNHIKKGWSHPHYSRNVKDFISKVQKKQKIDKGMMGKIADYLRKETKKQTNKGAIDDMVLPTNPPKF